MGILKTNVLISIIFQCFNLSRFSMVLMMLLMLRKQCEANKWSARGLIRIINHDLVCRI